jgi:hypothetical protein
MIDLKSLPLPFPSYGREWNERPGHKGHAAAVWNHAKNQAAIENLIVDQFTSAIGWAYVRITVVVGNGSVFQKSSENSFTTKYGIAALQLAYAQWSRPRSSSSRSIYT